MTDFSIPITGKNTIYLDRAEMKLEAMVAFLKQKSTEGDNFAPKVLRNISAELEDCLNLLIEIDRCYPEEQ